MNRTELIDYISEKADLTKVAASKAFDALLDGIMGSLQKGDPVVIVNFGSFTVKDRAARQGRNPSTGKIIEMKATKVVGFKAGKALKDAVKRDAEEVA